MNGQSESNTNKHITEYLKYFVNLDNPKYAVMLIGKWGCGKTYYIKNLIKNWEEKTQDEENSVVLKPVYVSVNGIRNTKTITDKIKSEISPFIYKTKKIAQTAINVFSKIAIKTDWNFDNNTETNENITFSPDLMSIFSPKNENIKGNKILIFDDVERCKIAQEELFGYINNFVEHLECKVIVIANEEKLNTNEKEKKENNYKEIKEKLIGQTFEIESDIDTAVDIFIEDSKEVNIKLDLSQFKNLIIEFFVASKTNNLRVLRQALLDFRRLTTFIDDKFINHSRYNEFIENFLAYFLIVYLEHKTGNDKVGEFQNTMSSLLGSKNKDEDENCKLGNKYNSILEKKRLFRSEYVFPIGAFLLYIQKGNIDNLLLNNKLEQSTFFLSAQTQDWEKLWRWKYWNGEYSEFVKLRDKVWKQFAEGNISQPLVVTHIAGTMLSLIDANMLKKNKPFIVSKAKSILKRIFEKDKYVAKHNVYGLLANAREYNAESSPELKEITSYLYKQVDNDRKKMQQDEMKNLFENLQNDFESELYKKLQESTPDRHSTYEMTAIFQSVNAKKLCQRLKSLNNKSIRDFIAFIQERYNRQITFPNMEDYRKNDYKCLEDLKNELSKQKKSRDKIKNIALEDLIKEIQTTISCTTT